MVLRLPQLPPLLIPSLIIQLTLFIGIIVIIRYLIAWFVGTLASRGAISSSARAVIIKILDILVIISVATVTVHLITASLTPYIVTAIIGILVLVLFYHEIKEFTAFITVHLQHYARGSWVEIKIPNMNTSIKGKLVDIQPFNSIIEDIHGNRVYIANSLLVNSLIKEYRPNVLLKIQLSLNSGASNAGNLSDLISNKLREIVSNSPFRLDEDYLHVLSLNREVLVFTVRLIPFSTPVRTSDLLKVMTYIRDTLSEYSPNIEVSEA